MALGLWKPVKEGNTAMSLAPHALVREKAQAGAARLEHACDLTHDDIKVGGVLNNLIVDDHVEGRIRKGGLVAIHTKYEGLKVVRNLGRVVAALIEDFTTDRIRAGIAHEMHYLTGTTTVVEYLELDAVGALLQGELRTELIVVHNGILWFLVRSGARAQQWAETRKISQGAQEGDCASHVRWTARYTSTDMELQPSKMKSLLMPFVERLV